MKEHSNDDKEISKDEIISSLTSTTQNIKSSIHHLIQNESTLRKPVDSLILGFFIGYFSSKTNKLFTDTDYQNFISSYISSVKTTNHLDSLLQLQSKLFSDYLYSNPSFSILNEDTNDSIHTKEMIECPICLQQFDVLDEMNYILDCNCIIHSDCFDQYIIEEIQSNRIPIKCPLCSKEVNQKYIYDSLKSYDNIEMIERYDKFCLNYYMNNGMNNVLCCPTAGCNYMFVNDENQRVFGCPLCEKKYCLLCRMEDHGKMTCEEVRKLKDEHYLEQKFFSFASRNLFKQCPHCKFWVEKNEGCDHITCRCGFEFCYRCGNEYSVRHNHLKLNGINMRELIPIRILNRRRNFFNRIENFGKGKKGK